MVSVVMLVVLLMLVAMVTVVALLVQISSVQLSLKDLLPVVTHVSGGGLCRNFCMVITGNTQKLGFSFRSDESACWEQGEQDLISLKGKGLVSVSLHELKAGERSRKCETAGCFVGFFWR